MRKPSHFFITLFVILTLVLAFGLRFYAANHLNVDHDETTYLIASNSYANYIREEKLNWLSWETWNYEHPSLNKIIFGLALLTQDPLEKVLQNDLIDMAPIKEQQAWEYALAARYVSVGFGSLAVLLLSILNPLAGLFLAVDTLAIKYTSEVYLEALPMLASLLAVVAYSRFYNYFTNHSKNRKKAWLWLLVSAASLGVTAASKYIYCVAGLAIGIHWIFSVILKKLPLRSLYTLLGWGVLSVFVFFILDPYLWVHTIERLEKTLSYHFRFQASPHVANANYPFWQPLAWLFSPFAAYRPIHDPQANNAFLFSIDTLVFFLALIGLPRTYKRYHVFFLWIVIGLALLFMWGSKWAQYPLIIIAPWCFSAAQGFFTLIDLFKANILIKPSTAKV
ncbi:MAG TPA: hypothetical protein DIW44_04940 [Anaerolineaceae bacterium]|nr:hypothetical protein [Anaerolineaceae bacterium]